MFPKVEWMLIIAKKLTYILQIVLIKKRIDAHTDKTIIVFQDAHTKVIVLLDGFLALGFQADCSKHNILQSPVCQKWPHKVIF